MEQNTKKIISNPWEKEFDKEFGKCSAFDSECYKSFIRQLLEKEKERWEIPQKIKPLNSKKDYQVGFSDGFNQCLEELKSKEHPH